MLNQKTYWRRQRTAAKWSGKRENLDGFELLKLSTNNLGTRAENEVQLLPVFVWEKSSPRQVTAAQGPL